MLAFEFLLKFVYSLIIATVATTFAGATVFSFYKVSRKPSLSFKIMNVPLLGLLTTIISFVTDSKITSAFLFFFAYLFIMRRLSEHLSKFDDVFRAFFLSMGYTRQEYLMNILFKYGKWKLINSMLSFSFITTSILVVLSETKRLIPDQAASITAVLLVLFAIIYAFNWIGERDGNKLSNPE